MNAQRLRIAPQSGVAFTVQAGDVVRVVDPEGEQVCDLLAFNADDRREALSSGGSIDYNSTIYLTTGHTLFSNRGNPMLTIVRDDVGRHDFLLAPCSQDMFERLHGVTGEHPSCLANLADALAPFGVEEDAIPTAFNIFMNVEIAADGRITVGAPASRAGDGIELRAEMPLVIAATACSSEWTNNGRCKPIEIEVVPGA